MNPDTEYLLQRAREEAHRALRSDQPQVAATHQALTVRYSAQAVISLVEEAEVVDGSAQGKP